MKKEEKYNQGNAGKQDTDKAPGGEHGKAEKVTTRDLKGKKVDADPAKKQDQPVKDTS